MIRSIIIILLCSLCACSSQKSATMHESTLMNEQVTTDSVATGTKTSHIYDFISAVCDSISFSFTADSIVTSDAVIYRPFVSVDVTEPSVAVEKAETTIQSDSVSQHIEKIDSVATLSDSTTYSETVAAAKPLDLTWIFIFCPIVAAIVLLIACILLRKNVTK